MSIPYGKRVFESIKNGDLEEINVLGDGNCAAYSFLVCIISLIDSKIIDVNHNIIKRLIKDNIIKNDFNDFDPVKLRDVCVEYFIENYSEMYSDILNRISDDIRGYKLPAKNNQVRDWINNYGEIFFKVLSQKYFINVLIYDENNNVANIYWYDEKRQNGPIIFIKSNQVHFNPLVSTKGFYTNKLSEFFDDYVDSVSIKIISSNVSKVEDLKKQLYELDNDYLTNIEIIESEIYNEYNSNIQQYDSIIASEMTKVSPDENVIKSASEKIKICEQNRSNKLKNKNPLTYNYSVKREALLMLLGDN